jgi:hypothetical protein
MSRKKQQVLERLIGNGKVYKDDQFLSEVRYDLQIAQEYFIVKSLSGNEEVPGLKNISGHQYLRQK